MPWRIERGAGCPDSKPFAVVKESDGSRVGCHDTRESATAQLRALYGSERINHAIRSAVGSRHR